MEKSYQLSMSMKKIGLFFLVLLVGAGVVASCQNSKPSTQVKDEEKGPGVYFEYTSVKEALEAKKGKPLFIDCYASWCGPCKQLEHNVFPKEKVGKLINENFTPVKLDADSPEGQQFTRSLQINGLPTMLVYNESGEIHRIVGYRNSTQIIDEINVALQKLE
jgi:thiol:disulfide interchange protein